MRDENSTTRLLVALCQFKPIRDVVIRQLTRQEYMDDDIEFQEISDQVTLDCGRPDVVINSTKLHILVEVKTSAWTVLQGTQPKTYLKWLQDAQDIAQRRFFVFLAPLDYAHINEYKKRCDEFFEENSQTEIQIIDLNWMAIVEAIEKAGLDDAILYARDFCNALREWYVPTKIAFSNKELSEVDMFNKDALEAQVKIFSLIESITSELKQAGFNITPSFKKRWWDNDEYGIYIYKGEDSKNDFMLWFGVWTEYWRKTGNPLVIGVDQDWKRTEYFKKCFPHAAEFKKYWTMPIEKNLLMQDAVKDVMQWLNPYLTMISKS